MSTQNPELFSMQKHLSAFNREAAGFWRKLMLRHGSALLTLAAAAVTVLVVFLLGVLPRYQQDFSTETPKTQTPVTMLEPARLPAEQQRKLQWILQTQNPALLLRGDHPHSYTALWKKQKFASSVPAPDAEGPRFAEPEKVPFSPLESTAPEGDKLRKFVPQPVAPPVAAKKSRPRAYNENGRELPQLKLEAVNKPVTAPTRLILRKQGPLVLPQLLESCGVPDLDELAKQQIISSMPRLGEVREITVYWNSKEAML